MAVDAWVLAPSGPVRAARSSTCEVVAADPTVVLPVTRLATAFLCLDALPVGSSTVITDWALRSDLHKATCRMADGADTTRVVEITISCERLHVDCTSLLLAGSAWMRSSKALRLSSGICGLFYYTSPHGFQ